MCIELECVFLPINRCVNSSSDGGGEVASVDHQSSLYVGGVNSFLLHPNSSITTPDFLGGIRNVLVGGIQLNSNCPITDLNTMKGNIHVLKYISKANSSFPLSLPLPLRSGQVSWVCSDVLQFEPHNSVH